MSSSVPDVREADPHDRRDPRDLLIYNPVPPPPREAQPRVADAGDPHIADPRDTRDSTDPRNVVHGSGFTFPERGRLGQMITNTYGRTYNFDGDQWVEGPSTTATTYQFRIGIDETSPGIVDVMPATANGEIGGINEPAADGLYLRSAAGAIYTWAPAPPGTAYTFDTGLTLTGASVNLDPALPPGGEIGGINEPPADDGKQYTRSYTGGVGIWTESSAGITAGIGIDFVPVGSTNIDLLPATPTVIGGVSVVARSNVQGLDLTVPGALTAPLATDLLAGSIVEPPPDDLLYVRQRSLAGVSAWVPSAAGADFGIGISLDTTTVPPIANLQPAGDSIATLGGVYVVTRARSLTEGLELAIDGQLRVPLASNALAGSIVEPVQDGIAHTRKWDITTSRWIWEPALTAGLTITGLIPEYALIGPTEPPLLVHVIGSLFTATTEVLFDGAVVTSTYVSPTEITTTVTPATVLAPFTAVVTVREGATPGAGAEGFSYIATEDGLYQGRWQVAANTPDIGVLTKEPEWTWLAITADPLVPEVAPAALPGIGGVTITEGDHVVWTGTTFVVVTGPDAAEYGTGLAVDRTQTPPLVNLTPAGDSPATLGGVYVIDRARNVTEGLELGIDGRLRVPLATPRLAGSIVEPEDDGKGYVRTTLAGVSMWVPPADPIGTDYGTGLTKDDTATPPIVHLQPAGDSAATLGGVYVVDRVRNMTEGLELGADGRLRVPPATDSLLGGLREPPLDDKGYVRTYKGGVGAWVPPADTPLPGFGIGLSFDNTTPPGIVNLQPAGDSAALLGGVYVVDRVRTASSGLELDIDGALRAPLATEIYAGTILDPLPDALRYVRTRDLAGVSTWVPEATTDFGTGLTRDDTATPPIVHLQPAGDSPATLGGVYVIDRVRNVSEGLELGADGRLRAPLATDALAGTLLEPPPDDKGYVRRRTPAGVSNWVPPSDTLTDYGVGLAVDRTQTPPLVNLTPAGDSAATLGGVYVVDRVRTLTQGLELDIDGALRAPLATEILAGVLTEPLPDGLLYMRSRDVAGVSTWVQQPPSAGVDYGIGLAVDRTATPNIVNLTPAGDSAATLGGVYVVDRVRTLTSGLELDIDGALRAPLATEIYAGTIVEPPPDDLQYVRTRTAAGVSSWVQSLAAGVYTDDAPPAAPVEDQLWFDTDSGELLIYINDGTSSQWVQCTGGSSSASITVADAPPLNPPANQLWWDSDSGNLFIAYQDMDSLQWVQINTAAPPTTGITDAPSDGTPYSRQDAGWVAAAAGGGGLADAPADGTEYLRKDNAWVNPTAAAGAFLPLDGSAPMTGSLKLASGIGVSYLNAGGAGNQWVEMVSATTFDFLGSTAPFVYSIEAATNNISFAGVLTVSATHPTISLRAATSQGFSTFNVYGDAGFQPYWSMTFNDTGYDGDLHWGRSPGTPPAAGSLVDFMTVSRATGIVDFASTPTRAGSPLAMGTEMTSMEERLIARICLLEERLAKMEAR